MEFNRKQFSSILEALRASPRGMNVTEVARVTGMNRATVAKYLEMLYVSGNADMRLFGTSKVYYISQRMPISAFLNFSKDLIIVLDRDSRVLNANDSFFDFTGTRRDDVVHKNINHFAFPLKFDPPIEPHITQAINGSGTTVESYYRKKDRGYYFNVKFIPLVFDEGEKGVTVIFEDITEKKLAEKALHELNKELERKVRERTMELEKANGALRKSEAYLVEAQQIAHVGYWSYNFKTKGVTASDETYRLFGIKPGTVWDFQTFLTSIHPDYRALAEQTNDDVIGGKGPVDYEYKIILPDGSERMVHSMIEMRSDESGDVLEIFGTLQDVTERKRMEEALKESEGRYRMLIEKSYDVVYSVRPDGNIIYVSPQISRYGYKPEEVVNHNLLDFIPVSDKEILAGRFREEVARGEDILREFRLRGKDGKDYWAEVAGKTIFDEEGKPLFHVGTVRDISGRKQAEEALRDSELRFKTLFEGASTAIFIIDVGTRRITDCNDYAARLVGRPKEELIGVHHAILHPPDWTEQCRQNMKIHSRDGRVVNYETEILHKDGRRIPIFINSTINEIGGKKVMMGSYLDISELKRAEKSLRESEEKYRSLVENINDMVWETDENYMCTYSSPRSKDVLGFEPEELLGKMPFEFIVPEDAPRVFERIKPRLDAHEPFELLEYRVIRKDGESTCLETSGMPMFDGGGRFRGYRGVNRDITSGRKKK